ncbi:MAG TPA: aminoacyl-tRNA hydrolase [Candidatus Kapabacteria bacterium]|nr:aminoacyl-tRNA hydrolase [Candidatus Kapabacteria bacterium]
MKLIVGLGNPGKQYEKTRHNVGFMALNALRERLSKECDMSEWQLSKKFNADVCGGTLQGEKIILAKPMTFMNDSGQAVQLLTHFYSLTHRDLIVVHDEKDVPLGDIKVQTNRGAAGHNGVRSIMEHIGTQDFTRVRIGIASSNPKKMKDTPEFVLGKFGLFERKPLETGITKAIQELLSLLSLKQR